MDYRFGALGLLKKAIQDNEKRIEEALFADLHKHPMEGYMCETGLVLDEIEVDVVVRGILVLAVASAGFDAEGYVASMRIQTAVELQLGGEAFFGSGLQLLDRLPLFLFVLLNLLVEPAVLFCQHLIIFIGAPKQIGDDQADEEGRDGEDAIDGGLGF